MITAYVKPTNYCSVGCDHCYLPEAIRADKFRMSEEVFTDTCNLLKDMSQRRPNTIEPVMLLWHGGEPLTVPMEWYDMAGEVMDRIIPNRIETIQTSLVPLKDSHIPFIIDRLDSQIGSSIDFSQRKIKGSVENFHKLWMKKVDLAREHGILITPGVVPTINECGREQYMVDWFMDRRFRTFNVDRYNSYGNVFPDRPTNLEHSHFLIGLFDALMHRMETHGWAPVVMAITGGITGVLHQQGADRWGTTCQSDFVVVEPDGGLNTCPDKATVEDPHSYAKDGWKAFAASKFRRKWVRENQLTHKMPHCEVCENQNWCHSGCPITPNGPQQGEEECSGYKTYINHVRKYVENENNLARVNAYLDQMNEDIFAISGLVYGGGND